MLSLERKFVRVNMECKSNWNSLFKALSKITTISTTNVFIIHSQYHIIQNQHYSEYIHSSSNLQMKSIIYKPYQYPTVCLLLEHGTERKKKHHMLTSKPKLIPSSSSFFFMLCSLHLKSNRARC